MFRFKLFLAAALAVGAAGLTYAAADAAPAAEVGDDETDFDATDEGVSNSDAVGADADKGKGGEKGGKKGGKKGKGKGKGKGKKK